MIVVLLALSACTNKAEIQQQTAVAQAQIEASTAQAVQAAQSTEAAITALAATEAAITAAAATQSAQQTQEAISAATATAAAQATANAQATQQAISAATSTAEAEATAKAEKDAASTAEAITKATTTAQAREIARKTATAQAQLQATAEAQPLYDLVQKLNAEGMLTRSAGEYHPLPDFDESWAQRGWYMYFPTGYAPANFVLDADIWWEAADAHAENSGCGVVFRESDEGRNHYMIFFSIEGYVVLLRNYKDDLSFLSDDLDELKYDEERQAHITLVVDGDWFTYYVNGKKVARTYDVAIKTGNLHLTLVSGTNKDFGTHCKMENIGLWIFED